MCITLVKSMIGDKGPNSCSAISPEELKETIFLTSRPRQDAMKGAQEYWGVMRKSPIILAIGLYLFCSLFMGSLAVFHYGGQVYFESQKALQDLTEIDQNIERSALLYMTYFGFLVFSGLVSWLVTWILVAKYRHEKLLHSMLPRNVIKHLETGNRTYSHNYDCVTVFFCDIVSFTPLASELGPDRLMQLLDGVYCLFDRLAIEHDVYKVETIGDAYLAVSGCPKLEDPVKAAAKMANFARDVLQAIKSYQPSILADSRTIEIRVGLHSGPVVAGVIGKRMPRFCLFGDTVNTASRMESCGEPMRVHISAVTAELLGRCAPALACPSRGERGDDQERDRGEFLLTPRGRIHVKGKGDMETFWLD